MIKLQNDTLSNVSLPYYNLRNGNVPNYNFPNNKHRAYFSPPPLQMKKVLKEIQRTFKVYTLVVSAEVLQPSLQQSHIKVEGSYLFRSVPFYNENIIYPFKNKLP
jgi:hypothetical protein